MVVLYSSVSLSKRKQHSKWDSTEATQGNMSHAMSGIAIACVAREKKDATMLPIAGCENVASVESHLKIPISENYFLFASEHKTANLQSFIRLPAINVITLEIVLKNSLSTYRKSYQRIGTLLQESHEASL